VAEMQQKPCNWRIVLVKNNLQNLTLWYNQSND